jgi:putative phosphoribosyl transferase
MFRDRVDAGRQLAQALREYAGRDDVLVLGVPRGGIPVAVEVARALRAPLDVLIVRKLGAPHQQELAIGAIAGGGIRVLNRPLIEEQGIGDEVLNRLIARETAEIERREQLFRGVRAAIPVRGKTVILVDDGIATGASTLAAIAALRAMEPSEIIVAVPVAPSRSQLRIELAADHFVALLLPEEFYAISEFYEDFSQVEDSQVRELLAGAGPAESSPPVTDNSQAGSRGVA